MFYNWTTSGNRLKNSEGGPFGKSQLRCECSGWFPMTFPQRKPSFWRLAWFFFGCEGKRWKWDILISKKWTFLSSWYLHIVLAGIHQPVFSCKSIVGIELWNLPKNLGEILVNQILDNCFIQLDRLLVAGCLDDEWFRLRFSAFGVAQVGRFDSENLY